MKRLLFEKNKYYYDLINIQSILIQDIMDYTFYDKHYYSKTSIY